MPKEAPTYRLTVTSATKARKLLSRLDASGLGDSTFLAQTYRQVLEKMIESGDSSQTVTVEVVMSRKLSLGAFAHLRETQLWLQDVCEVGSLEEQFA